MWWNRSLQGTASSALNQHHLSPFPGVYAKTQVHSCPEPTQNRSPLFQTHICDSEKHREKENTQIQIPTISNHPVLFSPTTKSTTTRVGSVSDLCHVMARHGCLPHWDWWRWSWKHRTVPAPKDRPRRCSTCSAPGPRLKQHGTEYVHIFSLMVCLKTLNCQFLLHPRRILTKTINMAPTRDVQTHRMCSDNPCNCGLLGV